MKSRSRTSRQHSVEGWAAKRAWVSSIACLASFPPRPGTSCLQTALSENILSDALASTNSDKRPLATTPCHSSFHPRVFDVGKLSPVPVEKEYQYWRTCLGIGGCLLLPHCLVVWEVSDVLASHFPGSCSSLAGGLIHLRYDSTLIQRIFFFLMTEKCIQWFLHGINSLS